MPVEERMVPRYYPGQERDDGWTQQLTLTKEWKNYTEMIEEERAKRGIPPLSTIVPNPKLLEPKLKAALEVIEQVLWAGEAKYPDDRWRTQSIFEHITHALDHMEGIVLKSKANEEDHLAHAACRLLMALQLRAEKGERK